MIGSLLIENSGYDQVASIMSPSDCFRAVHRKVMQAIETLAAEQKAFDLRTVAERLKQTGDLDDVGPAYLASLVDGVPRATNVKYYAEIVREKATARALIRIGRQLVDDGFAQQQPSKELMRRVDSQLSELATAAKLSIGAEPLSKSLGKLTEDLDRRVSRRGQIIGLPTICKGLDDLTHGWQRRKMIVLAGQTSFGKSILALNCARAIAAVGARVVYYSFEMERQELEYRLVSSLSDVALTRILWGNLSPVEYRGVAQALEVMHELPIEINDSGARSVVDIRSECRQIKSERGLGAIVIDHFQLMQGVNEQGDSRYEQLAATSRRLKELATELDVPIFVLSQLTLSDKDANREPQLDDLRECKSLGHDADLVLMLHPYKPSEARTDTAVVPMKLLCRKQRGGRLGLVTLNLERDFVRFVEAEAPAKEAPKPKANGKAEALKSPATW